MSTVPAPSRRKRHPDEGPGAARTPSLGSSGEWATPPPGFAGDRSSKRLTRHALKALQRTITAARSSALCWYPGGAEVAIDVGRALTAHVSGILRCGSATSCVVCAPVVRQRRAGEIDVGVNGWLDRGGGGLFVTLTSAHQGHDPLAPRLAAMTTAVHDLLKGAAWERHKRRLGYVGAIRAIEVTWGRLNGWHPHNHIVLLFEKPVSEEQRYALWEWLHVRWSGILLAKGLGMISREHGVDVRQVTGDALGEYLTKVEGGWSTGLELARGDLKSSKGGLVPFDLLGDYAATGDLESRALWLEYEAATFGQHWLKWSPGLRKRLLGVEEEQSDEELAASEGVDVALLRWMCRAGDFRGHVQAGTTGLLLDEAEAAAGWTIWLCDLFGFELRPIEARGRSG